MDGTLIRRNTTVSSRAKVEDRSTVNVPSTLIQVYRGDHFTKRRSEKKPNVIVFDMDETLGSYTDLDIIWSHLKGIIRFNDLLDLYPEFSRYGILPILDYIYQKKMCGDCDKIFVYTNNQCSDEFVELISNYFSYKLEIVDGHLFDQIIRSFKIGNKRIEMMRTTKDKTHTDLIRCTLLPRNAQIFFIDNTYFPKMENSRIYYIQPLSYHHHLSKETIIRRLEGSMCYRSIPFYRDLLQEIYEEVYTFPEIVNIKYNTYFEMKKKNDMMVARKMMYYIRDFFHLTRSKRRTKKRRPLFNRVTRKIT